MLRRHRSLTRRFIDKGMSWGRRLPPPWRRAIRRAVLSPAPNASGRSPLLALKPAADRVAGEAAEVVTSFNFWAHRSELAATAVTVLSEAGIESLLLDSQRELVVVVKRSDKAAAIAALGSHSDSRHWWAVAANGKPLLLTDAKATQRLGNSASLFRKLVSPQGWHVADREAQIELQFWATAGPNAPRVDGGVHDPATLLAVKANLSTLSVTAQQWQEAQSRPGHRLALSTIPHVLELHEPVDLVYTWVDDQDPAWQQRRAQADPTRRPLAADALDPARTRAGDHLRYSLRSAAMYAGWARHIWIVTDAQTPDWLVPDHPNITVIDHREIFSDPTVLPTFNSQAIESQLHHIPGLAEHFLYLNDDFFFGAAVRPEDFFEGNGVATFMMSSVPVDRDADDTPRNAAMLAARRNRALLERTFHRTVTNRMQHVPNALTKTTLQSFEDQFPDLVAAVASSQFRSSEDYAIPSDLAHYYGYARSEAVPGSIRFRYVDVGSATVLENLESLLVERSAQTFCLNDVGAYTEPLPEELIDRFLAAYFPVASPFETEARP
jgi:L-rhamnose mutarotase